MTTTELSTPKRQLKDYLLSDAIKRQLADAMPRTMSPDRFIRIALQATYRNPALLKTSPESFFNCLIQLAALGLDPDGRRAHLVPYGNDCTLIIDYKGVKELLRRNKDVSAMHCDVVGQNDTFEIRFGSHGILDHVPNLRDRGAVYCAYSWVRLPDGTEEFDVMGIDEIQSVRRRSRTPDKGPWVTDFNEMAKKTVFRRHSKSLPLSPESRDALERETDGDALTESERFNAAVPARAVLTEPDKPKRGRPPRVATNGPEDSSEPFPAPAETEQKPSLSVAVLADQVALKLDEEGFKHTELFDVLRSVNFIKKNQEVRLLSDLSKELLQTVLGDWDNVVVRLNHLRKTRAGQQEMKV
jgi:recombination protein RecT